MLLCTGGEGGAEGSGDLPEDPMLDMTRHYESNYNPTPLGSLLCPPVSASLVKAAANHLDSYLKCFE